MCNNWTDTSLVGSAWGAYNRLDFWSASCSGGNTAVGTCGSANPLYCFQQ